MSGTIRALPAVARTRGRQILSVALLAGSVGAGFVPAAPVLAEKVHLTYHWHLEQPIYWPDQQVAGYDRYERAWESIQRTDGGAPHPESDLREIFGKDDRVAAYQWRPRDAIDQIRWCPEAGAQVSYTGGLIENVTSLGDAGQLGYTSAWMNPWREARQWTTTGGSQPRCDLVLTSFHHALLPLCDSSAVRKEIQLYKAVYAEAWGSWPGLSSGFFCPETAFSERLIKILVQEGVQWVLVSNEHISRACENFPLVLGSGGVNCDPPNRADQINPAQDDWLRISISRGCSPVNAYPFAYTPHRAKYVDPDTGQEYKIIVVPTAQAISWEDGYAPIGLDHFDTLQTRNPPSRPQLVVMAHDGDNAWGGGYSYYMEAVPNFVSQADAAGYVPTVIQQYLLDHPVPADDVVHVEDGAWVNADGDFGSPIFINWNWPLVDANGQIDIPNGWAEDERNWAVITAAQNRVDTAEQIAGPPDIDKILHPDASASPVERAWHYLLAALNSGYMYYGTALDMEVKPTIACNEAVEHADAVIGDGSLDATPPTIWLPQRHPYNPGSTNFGAQWGYAPTPTDGDFWVWTFVYDVSGVDSVVFKYRMDADGVNPLSSNQNETYAGGPEVGSWQTLAMTCRTMPTGNVYNDPNIDFFELPAYIADEYYVHVTGLRDVLIDYFVEATDIKGHTRRSPIQHVYIGPGGASGDRVTYEPDPPQAGQDVTISYNAQAGPLAGAAQVYLHYGFDNWSTIISPDPAMTQDPNTQWWQVTVPVPTWAVQIDLVFHDGAGTWDNNNGADWHKAVQGGQPGQQWVMDGILDAGAVLVAENNGMYLWAGLIDDELYVACNDAGEGNDHFIYLAASPGPLQPANWAKAGQVAAWDCYLADENDNDWEGWFDTEATVRAATPPTNGGVLEGTIPLEEHYGLLPEAIYLAVAPFATPDGGSLIHESQVPASVNGDGNVDAAEFVRFQIVPVPGDLDRDGDVDLADYDALNACYSGPGQPLPNLLPEHDCELGDLDGDNDVDLLDYATFQANYTG